MENQAETDPRIVNWTQEEKILLFKGLKKYGSRNIPLFSGSITGKNEEEIKAAIQFYKEDLNNSSRKRKRESSLERSLNRFSEIISSYYADHPVRKEMAADIYLIAMFEPRSPPSANNGIDLQKIYLMMSKMIEGKPIQFDSKDLPTMRYLHDCFLEVHAKAQSILGDIEM